MESISEIHIKKSKFQILLILALSLVTLILAITSMGVGSSENLGFFSTFKIVLGIDQSNDIQSSIIWRIRLPRVIIAIVGGAALATAGALMQGSLGNPLVSPLTLGVASGAALGAALGIIIGFSISEPIGIIIDFLWNLILNIIIYPVNMISMAIFSVALDIPPIPFTGAETVIITNAFIFSLFVVFLIIKLGNYRSVSAESYILVGIAITFICGAIVSTMTYFASDSQLSQLTHWSFGSLARTSLIQSISISIIIILLMPNAMKWAWDLNSLSLGGDDFAISTGVDPIVTRKKILILSAFMTSIIISFTGLIGFLGLAAPHMSRLIVGNDYRKLIPCSAVFGSLLMLFADTLGRTLFAPIVIPVGIMLSIIGGPFFMYLLLQKRRKY